MINKLEQLSKPLKKEDIEIRVGSCGKSGATFLLYKTARVDIKRLNEVFGFNWKREHYVDSKGNYICKVSIYNEDLKEWVSREDVGTKSKTEEEKGGYSDSFKRACTSFSSGIELYSAPFIFIKNITKEKNNQKGKYELADPFYSKKLKLTKYDYKDGVFDIEIKCNNNIVFTTGAKILCEKNKTKKSISFIDFKKLIENCESFEELRNLNNDNYLIKDFSKNEGEKQQQIQVIKQTKKEKEDELACFSNIKLTKEEEKKKD